MIRRASTMRVTRVQLAIVAAVSVRHRADPDRGHRAHRSSVRRARGAPPPGAGSAGGRRRFLRLRVGVRLRSRAELRDSAGGGRHAGVDAVRLRLERSGRRQHRRRGRGRGNHHNDHDDDAYLVEQIEPRARRPRVRDRAVDDQLRRGVRLGLSGPLPEPHAEAPGDAARRIPVARPHVAARLPGARQRSAGERRHRQRLPDVRRLPERRHAGRQRDDRGRRLRLPEHGVDDRRSGDLRRARLEGVHGGPRLDGVPASGLRRRRRRAAARRRGALRRPPQPLHLLPLAARPRRLRQQRRIAHAASPGPAQELDHPRVCVPRPGRVRRGDRGQLPGRGQGRARGGGRVPEEVGPGDHRARPPTSRVARC